MIPTTEILRGELERRFELDEMIALSQDLLGLDPADVGGVAGKGAYARALVERCVSEDALEALAEAIVLSPKGQASAAEVERALGFGGGDLPEGTQVGEFTLGASVASGSLGTVYEARRGDDPRRLALKVIRSDVARDRAAVRRFLTVSRALSQAGVPGVVPVVAVGTLDDGRPWIATEWVEGQTLAARIGRVGAIHINEVRPVFRDVLEALSRLHQRGVVHGHVTAENIFVAKGEPPAQGKKKKNGKKRGAVTAEARGFLIDGGSDRLLPRPEGNGSRVVPVFGAAKVLDPDLLRGQGNTPKTDLYALAATLYEVVAGRPPFVADFPMEVVAQRLVQEVPPPSSFAPAGWVAPALDQMLLRALSKDPAERYPTAADMLRALEELSSKKSSSVSPRADFDEPGFRAAADALRKDPGSESKAEEVEQVVAPAFAWEKAVSLFAEMADQASDAAIKVALWLRIARIYRLELEDRAGAEGAYKKALAIDPSSASAHQGRLELLRAGDDAEAYVEALLGRAE
ncbi:MAG: serine/threonine protein kinase, partial [Myxococcales bacterium]|nr:serine/threonine protein kinase [Myxococcales bacterium]